jgi:hypothetical protein
VFSFLHRHKPSPAGLLTSKLFDDASFYSAFTRDLNRCSVEAVIESPFVTRKRIALLSPIFRKMIKRGVKISVRTRHPRDYEGYMRAQVWEAIDDLKYMGVRVKLMPNMHHRKVAILDGAILWEGSLNILSQCYSREIMRRTESVELAGQMLRFIGARNIFQMVN